MSILQTLLQEIEESKRWLDIEKDDLTYKRDLQKKIELINWVLENMKNPDIPICDNIEFRMCQIIIAISELRILIGFFVRFVSQSLNGYNIK